jgi:hypothetical protein
MVVVAEGVRLQLVVSAELAAAVRERAREEGLSVSRLGADLLAAALQRPGARRNSRRLVES